MSKRDPRVYLYDILDNIDCVMEFVAGGAWDLKTRYAVERALTIIGEAARRIPDEAKAAMPQIPWHEMKGLRNVLMHEYETINPAIIKDICDHHLAPLRMAIMAVVGKE